MDTPPCAVPFNDKRQVSAQHIRLAPVLQQALAASLAYQASASEDEEGDDDDADNDGNFRQRLDTLRFYNQA